MKIFITGANGLIGRRLTEVLSRRGHAVQALCRSDAAAEALKNRGAQPIAGDATKVGPWLDSLVACDAVIHLAGATIFHRWSPSYKEKIRASRVESTRLIAGALSRPDAKPRVFLSGSAMGYYGADVPAISDEYSPAGQDFLAQVCVSWERAACVSRQDVRTLLLRTGIVLAADGGALKQMLPAFKLGLGGKLGSGRQMMSWIHIDDWVGAALFLLEQENLSGPFNFTAPYAVSNDEFTKTMGNVLKRPVVVSVPGAVLKMALGEMSATVLGSQQVRPARLLEAGYRFQYPDLRSALSQILAQN